MIRFLTAGESHGKGLTIIVEGFPSNLPFDIDLINQELKRRQSGYGRGLRMKIETDKIELLSGVRFGKTLGSPIAMFIKNYDWEAWTEKMNQELNPGNVEKISVPRPGHADLTGTQKYRFNDIRNSIERSSARETASRVAAGAVAKLLLDQFDIKVGSFVESIGGEYANPELINKLFSNVLFNEYGNAAELLKKEDLSKEKFLNIFLSL